MPVPADEVARILTALGLRRGRPQRAGDWQVTVPGWRPDVARPEDLIEEVGRHHGFEHLPATFPPVLQAPAAVRSRASPATRASAARCSAAGFSEAITFAFIEEAAAAPFANGSPPIRLANPLSETFAVMRPSLLPGPGRRGRPQPPARAARRAAVRDRHRVRTRRRTALARRGVDRRRRRRSLERPPPRRRLLRPHRAWSRRCWRDLRAGADLRAGRHRPGSSPAAPPGSSPAARPIGTVGLLAPAIADAHGAAARRRRVTCAELDLDRLTALAPRGSTRRRAAAPLPVGGARRVAARARHLVCRHRS